MNLMCIQCAEVCRNCYLCNLSSLLPSKASRVWKRPNTSFDITLNRMQTSSLVKTPGPSLQRKRSKPFETTDWRSFIVSVKRYFVVVCDYLVGKLPLQQELLKHAEVVDARLQVNTQSADFLFFLDTYPVLIPAGSTKDSLLEEFSLYHEQT